ncbi:MAG: D-alanine--D-alanine ligase [Candidatus Omnitrophica bacterium]|nr:D-alanine--D-alanine ligase [Candidatus Omnitrophota bacterium]
MVPLRVAVLMGGPSGEHDVSLRSGRGIAEALARRGMRVSPVVVPQSLTPAQACEFVRESLAPPVLDAVFIALHGAFGEDGTVQQVCEDLRVAYTGSGPAASRLGMDKVASRQAFAAAGLAIPTGWVVNPGAAAGASPADLTFPIVVKPASQGSSLGISIVHDAAQLAAAVEVAGQYDARVLLEAFVRGRELTVGVLGDEALPVIEIRPHRGFFDYAAKYTSGLTDYLAPAPLPTHVARIVQAAGLRAHQALGCRHLSRADFILSDEGRPMLLEVNTVPGFTPTSLLPKAAACVGISYDALCEQVVILAAHDAPQAARTVSHG